MPKIITLEEINKRLKLIGFQPVNEYIGQLKATTNFVCPGCCKYFTARLHDVLRRHVVSCGCLRGRNNRKGTTHISRTYFSIIKQHAQCKQRKSRNYEFNITIEYITELLIQQNFKCALSGLPIVAGYDISKMTASLDRIDNKKGYVPSNIQWVHKDINWLKQDFEENYFIMLCKNVAKHHKDKYGY
jgi:hypothetical protein